MRKFTICLLFGWLFVLSGCAVRIVPEPVPGGSLSADGNSLTITSDKVSITAGVVEEEIIGNQDRTVSSIHLVINNQGENEVVFDTDSFLLLDMDNRQYFALSPEKVRQVLAKDTYYLLPYPYVGFYYLEDYEKSAFKNTTETTLPFYYELNPQELFSRALPVGPVIPKGKISGIVYFQADVQELKSFRLLVYRKGQSKASATDFAFPFRTAK